MTTDEEALALTMNVLERIVSLALDGFKDNIDPDQALSAINNLGRETIDALAARRIFPIAPTAGRSIQLKALEKAREYVESDVRNKKYPSAIETLAAIDAALALSSQDRA